MKSHVADYQTRIYALRIVARDSTTVRFVGYPHDLVMGANTYQSDAGYEFSGFSATSSTSPSVIDLEGILSAAGISRDQMASGVWDGAKAFLFATSWTDPTEDEEPIAQFILGKTHIRDDRFACELMQLIDAVNQEVGRTIGATCPWQFGGAECGVNLATHTVTGALTSVTDAGLFADSAIAAAAGTYDGGTIEFTSGDNAGLRALEVQKHTAGGALQLFLPFHYLPQVGDAYELIRGCAKTRAACKTYSNIANFGGFPDQPTSNMVNKVGGQ